MHLKKEIRSLIIVYLSTWGIFSLLFCIGVWQGEVSFKAGIARLLEIIPSKTFLIAFHLFFLIIYVLFIIFRYAVRGYKKKGWLLLVKRLSVSLILPILVVFLTVKGLIAKNSQEFYDYTWNHTVENTTEKATNLYKTDGKHRGMSVFWSYDSKNDYKEDTKDVIKDNIEWATVIPFIGQQKETTNRVEGSVTPGVFSKRDSSVMRRIGYLQERGIRVHLKPHIWLTDGWRSNITLSEDDWDIWFESYKERMLQYARIAEVKGVPLFCIGTELRTVIKNKPEVWLFLFGKS